MVDVGKILERIFAALMNYFRLQLPVPSLQSNLILIPLFCNTKIKLHHNLPLNDFSTISRSEEQIFTT